MVDLNFSDDDEEIIFVAELKSCEQKLSNFHYFMHMNFLV